MHASLQRTRDESEISASNSAMQVYSYQLRHCYREIQNLMRALQQLDQSNCLLESENFDLRKQANVHSQIIRYLNEQLYEQRRANDGLLLKLYKIYVLQEAQKRSDPAPQGRRAAECAELNNLKARVKELEAENARLRVTIQKPRKKMKSVANLTNQLLEQAQKSAYRPAVVSAQTVKNMLETVIRKAPEVSEVKPIVCDLLPRRAAIQELSMSPLLLRFVKALQELPKTQLDSGDTVDENARYKTALRLQQVNAPQTTYKCLAQLAQLAYFVLFDAESLCRLADGIFAEVGGLAIRNEEQSAKQSALPKHFPTYDDFYAIRDELQKLFSACVMADFKTFDYGAFVRLISFHNQRAGASIANADLKLMACGAVRCIHNALVFVFQTDRFKATNAVRDVFIEAVNSEYISSVYSEIFDIVIEYKWIRVFQSELFAMDEPGFANFSLIFGVLTALELADGWEAVIFEFTSGTKRNWQRYAEYVDETDIYNAADDDVLEAQYVCYVKDGQVTSRGCVIQQ